MLCRAPAPRLSLLSPAAPRSYTYVAARRRERRDQLFHRRAQRTSPAATFLMAFLVATSSRIAPAPTPSPTPSPGPAPSPREAGNLPQMVFLHRV